MTGTGRVRLTLDLDLAAEPIRGQVGVGESVQAFFGWLDLARVLDAARAGVRDDNEQETGHEEDPHATP